jgi:hypothetical protein
MIKKLAVLGLSAFALTGLFAAPAANAAAGCASVYLNVNGDELVNQTVCTPA